MCNSQCNSSHHLQKATEKVLFAYKLTQNKVHQSTLRHCIQYEKTVFQWRPYRGEGILATVVKINNNTSSLETFEDQKLLFKGQLDLRKPMVQTDNSQSHRFSLSKYRGADDAVKKNTQCCDNRNRNRISGKLFMTIYYR